jgi:hypothetical protein
MSTDTLPSDGHPTFVTPLSGRCLLGRCLALGNPFLSIRCREMSLSARYPTTDVLPLLITHWLESVYRAVV